MAIPDIAMEHARRQVALGRRVAEEIGRLWRLLLDLRDIAASWARAVPRALGLMAAGQTAAADASDRYVGAVASAYGIRDEPAGRVRPQAFAGTASDGRDMASLLYLPAITVLTRIGEGVDVDRAAAMGAAELDMVARTQIADAGRVADGVAITAQKQLTGYVRMIVGDTCSRCIILAGRWYQWNDGFERHPRCDCRHIPAAEAVAGDPSVDPEAYFETLTEADQNRVFTKAGAQAIRDGADMNRVVNARRGIYTAGGRLYTREATTRRGTGRRVRLMPEQIYKEAGDDRDEAIRLLRLHGYITTVRATVDGDEPQRAPVRDSGLPQRTSIRRAASTPPPPPRRPGDPSVGDPELPDLGALVDADLDQHQGDVEDGFAAALERDYGDGFLMVLEEVSPYEHGPPINKFVRLDIRRNGLDVGELSLMYYRDLRGDLVAYHALIRITDEQRGARFGTNLMDHLERWYRASRVSRIEFTANIDVGGYAWASMKYDFATQADAETIVEPLGDSLDLEYATVERLREQADTAGPDEASRLRAEADAIEEGALAAEAIVERAGTLPFGDPRFPTAYEISQVGRRPGMGRADLWLGKRIMLGSSWEAVRWLR